MARPTPKLRPGVTVESLLRGQATNLPLLLGFEPLELEPGRLTAQLSIGPQHLAPNGYLHAATIVMLADTACGLGCWAHLPDGANGFTTIELKANLLGTALDGTISAEATAAHAGRSTQVWDAVVQQGDRTLALFRCTQMVLYPKR
ncbi:MAG TPA: PaaI family thioesterase [Burkholderiaceae bacterium]|jgi:1,4-dihydroxy-2-naphthoyl-CoA hydrolase|nr:PaaI family thioesterase [Burkholderiaceae bacterium]